MVRDAHLEGKWEYCQQIRKLIGDRKPVVTYPEHPVGKQSLVFVYDWSDEASPDRPRGDGRPSRR